MVGRDISIGIATHYGLDGLRIESALVQTCPRDHPASYTMDTGSFLGVQLPGRDIDPLGLQGRL